MDVTNPSPADGPHRRPDSIGGLRRADPFARGVALSWRRLTAGGGTTLIACSGGADSTALLLALALATRNLAVAHIMHDLRPRVEVEADRDAVRNLAAVLSFPYFEAEARISDLTGNKESLARSARYSALLDLARTHEIPFVATAHHADDQLETLLMALLRGAGPHGLRGIAPIRSLASHPPITLIRPMLHSTRMEARAACTAAGIAWREDATNLDVSRRRAALRHRVLPLITAMSPEAPRRAAHTAELLRDAARLIDERVAQVFGDALSWDRASLRRESALILGLGLKRAFLRLKQGRRGDALTARLLNPAVRAIRNKGTDPAEFHWPEGARLEVSARTVTLR